MRGSKIEITKFILDETGWVEVLWEQDGIQIHCESFSGYKEHIALLRAKAKEYNTSLEEYEPLIKQCQDTFVYPSEEDIRTEIEKNRILCIKSEAGRVINEKYSDTKQRNILMSGDIEQIKVMNEYILGIRQISNKAEEDGLEYNQIDWGI